MSEKRSQFGCVVIKIEGKGINGTTNRHMLASTLEMSTSIAKFAGIRTEIDNTINVVLKADNASHFAELLNRFGIRSEQVYGNLVAEKVIDELKQLENN